MDKSHRVTRRYWIRTNEPAGWWPWGLIPAVGLVAAFLFGSMAMAPNLEARVLEQVQDRLTEQDIASTSRADGQGISIHAIANESDRTYIDALARSTRCDTWIGKLTCPTTIALELDSPPVTAKTARMVSTPAVSESETDSAQSGAIASVEEPVATATVLVDECNRDFAALFEESTITFGTNRADIGPQNDALLNRIVDVASRCPGALRIEGHTDSRGDAGMNLALSIARAESVRNALVGRGVDNERMSAEGFGESNPIANNSTADGRATNRRIVISVEQ